jgi:hypothetical protein
VSCDGPRLRVRTGNTFRRVFTYTRNGIPYNLTGATFRSQLRGAGGVQNMVLTALPQAGATLGKVELTTATGFATGWQVGEMRGDIEFTFADGTKYTCPQFFVDVEEVVTQ